MSFFPDLLTVKKKAGVKVIAGRGFKSGESVVELHGEIIEASEMDCPPYVKVGDIQVTPTQFMRISCIAKDIRHSCDPNCGLTYSKDGKLKLIAIRAINPMEQISWDFSTTMTCIESDFDCECNSKLCRRKVGNYSKLPKKLRDHYEYLGIVAPYLAPMTVIR